MCIRDRVWLTGRLMPDFKKIADFRKDNGEAQLGVAYNAHVIEAILTHIAPALGWR